MPKSNFSYAYRWPLNDSSFTLWDRLKVCAFLLNRSNRWTQGKIVQNLEDLWARYVGVKYAVMTSSGSSANEMIAEYIRSRCPLDAKTIVVPAMTWQTSVSVWVKNGFKPHFIDVNLSDFSMDVAQLEDYLKSHGREVACVFPTSLLGLNPDIFSLVKICQKYNVPLRLDNCENIFGEYKSITLSGAENIQNICSFATSSTSFYFGHQCTTGGEGGMIFTNDEEEYCYYLLNRNHGMVRMLIPYAHKFSRDFVKELENPDVDPRFDFAIQGNNYRSTDLFATMGIINYQKMARNIGRRRALAKLFYTRLDENKYLIPNAVHEGTILMCLPVVVKDESKISMIKKMCESQGIETRPIISGNLLRQTCYKGYGDYKDFKNANFLHTHGFYVGLYPALKENKVVSFVKCLNSI